MKSPQAITYTPSTFVLTENRAVKIFGTRDGHIIDTPENRKILLDVANDPTSIKGFDRHGLAWHSRDLPNGDQIWVQVRNGKIWNGGINNPPKNYNPDTGFSSPIKAAQKRSK